MLSNAGEDTHATIAFRVRGHFLSFSPVASPDWEAEATVRKRLRTRVRTPTLRASAFRLLPTAFCLVCDGAAYLKLLLSIKLHFHDCSRWNRITPAGDRGSAAGAREDGTDDDR